LEILTKYFPVLDQKQKDQFKQMDELYHYWNMRINVLSRKDIDHLYERHILHSLSIALHFSFHKEHKIMDLGTGGGFPGLPLAIMFPDTQFTLVDSTGKKIKVVQEVADALQLSNIRAIHSRSEELKEKFHIFVCRAVAPLRQLNTWIKPMYFKKSAGNLSNGLIALKGGDLTSETASFGSRCQIIPLSESLEEEFFASKQIVYLRDH
jgi:16S rRNA (guanine527-N7)-methyltransferase